MLDSFGREISYLRVSITDRCNFRCLYCMPEEGVPKKEHSDILSFEDMEKIISVLVELGITKIRVTGGEPLVRRGCTSFLKDLGNLKIDQLGLTTNGFYIDQYKDEIKEAKLDLLNISLDSLNAEKFQTITRGGDINKVLSGIDTAREIGVKEIKINAVLMKGLNDMDIRRFAEFGKEKGAKVRFIELMPFSVCNSYENYGISADEVIKANGLIRTTQKDYSNNAETYMFEDGLEIGFIRPITNKFCAMCNRVRLTADGKLLLCLHGNAIVDLKDKIEDREELKKAIIDGIKNKPKEHGIEQGVIQCRVMNSIGG